jgi:hypothetical protein
MGIRTLSKALVSRYVVSRRGYHNSKPLHKAIKVKYS